MEGEPAIPAMKYFPGEDKEPAWEVDPKTGESQPLNRAANYVEADWQQRNPPEAPPGKPSQPEAIYELDSSGNIVPNRAARKQEAEVIRQALAEKKVQRD